MFPRASTPTQTQTPVPETRQAPVHIPHAGPHNGLCLGLSGLGVPLSPAPSPVPSVHFPKSTSQNSFAAGSPAVRQAVRLYAGLDDEKRGELLKELLSLSSREVLVEARDHLEPMLRHDPFKVLPAEISLRILSHLDDPKSLAAASQVSRRWYLLMSDDCTWRRLCAAHHYRRLSAAGDSHNRIEFSGAAQEQSSVAISLGNLAEMVFDPAAAETIAPTSYRSHFRQQYLLKSAWETGGRLAARYVLQHTENTIVTTFIMQGDYMVAALDNSRILVFALNGRLLSSLYGHVMGVWALALDGDTMVSGGCDRDVRVWNLRTGICTRILKGHASTVRCLTMAGPDIAISGSRDSTLRVWDLNTGNCRAILNGHTSTVRRVWAGNGLCVSASYDGTAKVWRIADGELLHSLQGHLGQIYSLAVEGDTVVTGSLDMTIRVWSLSRGTCLGVLQGHLALVGQLALKNNILVSGASDSAIRVWDLSTMMCKHRIAAHDNSVTCLQFDGERIISGGPDGQIHIWDAYSGKHIRTLGHQLSNVWGLAARGDRLAFVGAHDSNTVIELLSFLPEPESEPSKSAELHLHAPAAQGRSSPNDQDKMGLDQPMLEVNHDMTSPR